MTVRARIVGTPKAALAAVLVAGSLAVTGLSAMLPAGAATGASGRTAAVTIRAIDREGKQVAVTAQSQGVGGQYGPSLTSAHPTQVPAGRWVVAASVVEPGGKGVTFADRAITVSGPMTVTFDARQGKPLRLSVDDPTVTQSAVDVEVFSPATGADLASRAGGEATYAIPGPLPAGWYFYVVTALARPNVAVSPVQYGLTRMFKGSIPASLTFASRKAGLADEHVTVRQVAAGDLAYLGFLPAAPNRSFLPFPDPGSTVSQYGSAPFSYDVYLTPGWRWQPCVQYQYNLYSSCNPVSAAALPLLAAGHHYGQTFGGAVFGPGGLTAAVGGTQLYVALDPSFSPITDPGFTTGSDVLPIASSAASLFEGSTLIGHNSASGPPYQSTGLVVSIPAGTHWYRLHLTASPLSSRLSKSVTLDYTFPAHAVSSGSYNVDSFWPRIVPGGLNGLNAALRGTDTTSGIWFTNANGRAITAHGVKVWASVNGGKTWTALRVGHSAVKWAVTFGNPASPGFVSLRVQGTDATGSTAIVTVINAYSVR
jgi:hypothetical protein